MRLIRNSGNDQVVDELRKALVSATTLDMASPAFSLFAFAQVRELLERLERCRLVLPMKEDIDLGLMGVTADRVFRNGLQLHFLARQCMAWIRKKVEVRAAPGALPQAAMVTGHTDSNQRRAVTGNCTFTTDGLGITPGNRFGLVQCAAQPDEVEIRPGTPSSPP